MLFADNKIKESDRISYLHLSRIYAHSKLEDILGYDILVTNSIETYNDIYNWYHEEERFIREDKAMDSNGISYNVLMYLWNHYELGWQGLVVLKDDEKGNKDALDKYNKKVGSL